MQHGRKEVWSDGEPKPIPGFKSKGNSSHSGIVPDITTTALVSMALPEIKITGHGILALRRWKFARGLLQSTVQDTFWREQMMADKPPNKENTHGLYGTEFSPEGLMRYGNDYLVHQHGNNYLMIDYSVFGLIQMRGKIEIHTDCIVRGEWARIVCLFVFVNNGAEKIVPELIKNYPDIPVYVLHKKQIAEVLFRTLNQGRQQDDDQRAH